MSAATTDKPLPFSARPRLGRWANLCCLAICLLVLGMTAAFQRHSFKLGAELQETFEVGVLRTRLALELTNQMAQCRALAWELVAHWDTPKPRTATFEALEMNRERLVDLVHRLRERTESPLELERFQTWIKTFREFGRRLGEIDRQFQQKQLTSLPAVREEVRSCLAYVEPTQAEIASLASTLKKLHLSSHDHFQKAIANFCQFANLRAAIALTIAIVTALWFHRRILRRIRVMTTAIEQWLGGERRVRLVALGSDEIDLLAQRCNQLMAEAANPAPSSPITSLPELDAVLPKSDPPMSLAPPPTPPLDDVAPANHVHAPRPLRVLVVDDGPENRRLMTLVLRKTGAETAVAENGLQALELALGKSFDGTPDPTAVPYDLVLLDMQMPIMDGFQAARQIRQEGYTGLIVAVTGNPDRQSCIDAGCDEYLRKPVDRDGLLTLVRRVQNGEIRAKDMAAIY